VECGLCGTPNREGARFCGACGSPLPRQCPTCKAELDPHLRFCDQCGTPVDATAPASAPPAAAGTLDAVRKTVTVLFADIGGSTGFGERTDPEVARQVLARYHALLQEAIDGQRGTVAKFMGDGMMATFNTRGDQPDHALRASEAALALQRELTALADANPGWPRLRVGVNSGEAVVRELGGHGFVAYAVIGDMVNTGSRLEGQAPVGGVLIGAGTWRALPDGAVVEPVPGLRVKGKQEAIDAYLLRSLPLSGW
jgi:adenylate cyclase